MGMNPGGTGPPGEIKAQPRCTLAGINHGGTGPPGAIKAQPGSNLSGDKILIPKCCGVCMT